jgi:hypothetical protein
MRWAWSFGASQFSEYDADGFLGIQIDPQGEDGGAALLELAHPYGFASRPVDPDADGLGCAVLVGKAGARDSWAWLGHDPRMASKVPELSKGASVQYGATGTFGLIDGEDGTWTQYVPCEFDGSGTPTKAHLVQVGLDPNGEKTISIVHADGMAITMFDGKTVISNKSGNAYIEIGDDGIVLNGNVKLNGGVDVGGTGGMPLVNHALFVAWWNAMAAAITTAKPDVPLAPSALGPMLATAGAGLAAVGTLITKGK